MFEILTHCRGGVDDTIVCMVTLQGQALFIALLFESRVCLSPPQLPPPLPPSSPSVKQHVIICPGNHASHKRTTLQNYNNLSPHAQYHLIIPKLFKTHCDSRRKHYSLHIYKYICTFVYINANFLLKNVYDIKY